MSEDKASHRQVCIKVNAYVDVKIAPLIEALSHIPGIITEFSCEDIRSELEIHAGFIPRAHVIFHVKEKYGDWLKLGEICNYIAKIISEYNHAEIAVRWKEGKPVGVLDFNTEDAYWLTQALIIRLRDQCLP